MISFIIPAYNVERYIIRTLESVLNQKKDDHEIIIIDDGSTDNTFTVVQDFIKDCNRLQIKLISQANGGVSSARNRGLAEASGDYVIFLDADDYVATNLIEKIKDPLEKMKPDILCWGYNLVCGDKTLMNYSERFNYDFNEMPGMTALEEIYLHRRFRIWTGSAAYRRDFLSRMSLVFTTGCSNGEDQEFIMKSLSVADKVVFLPFILSFYVQREDSVSYSYNPKKFEAIDAIERAIDYIKSNSAKDSKGITSYFENELIVENFLYNYNSSLEYLVSTKKLKFKAAIDYLNTDIDRHNPGLNEKVQIKMKKTKSKNIKFNIRLVCFRISPILYYFVIKTLV